MHIFAISLYHVFGTTICGIGNITHAHSNNIQFLFLYIVVDTVVSIERVGLHTFIEDVAKNSENLDSSTVVFGLQIAGWLGGNDVYYRQFWKSIHQVFTVLWQKMGTIAISDISVMTALYEGLTSLTRHAQSLQWIVSDTGMEGTLICFSDFR